MNEPDRPYAILHLAVNPLTGVLSVMRQLALQQKKEGLSVALGVLHDSSWLQDHQAELEHICIPFYAKQQPKLPGTLSFIYQRFVYPPLGTWVRDLANRAKVERVVIHCHNAWQAGVFLPLRRIGGIDCHFVATVHGVGAHFSKLPVHRVVHRWMGQRLLKYGAQLSSVDAVNPELAEKWFGIPREKITVIPNGQASTALSGCPFIKDKAVFTVGHVSNLVEGKGWKIAVDAVMHVARTGRRVHLLIAGRGADQYEVERYAHLHSENITYLGYQSDPINTVFPRLDLLALMSEREGLPMAILEAMSLGVPVATTPHGGSGMAVEDGQTGYVIPRTAKDLAEVIIELYDGPSVLARMHRQALAQFNDKFHISKIVDEYDSLYRITQ